MHSAPRILLLALALTGWAAADLPRKAPITKYTGLWTNSPFTSKPPPPEAGPVANPLEDYALAGVSPISGGYRVTLLNKKKPDERITVDSDKPKERFQDPRRHPQTRRSPRHRRSHVLRRRHRHRLLR